MTKRKEEGVKNTCMDSGLRKSYMVTVCDKCFRASCWQGEFMCDDAVSAGITLKSVKDLIALDREHSDYWKKDLEMKS